MTDHDEITNSIEPYVNDTFSSHWKLPLAVLCGVVAFVTSILLAWLYSNNSETQVGFQVFNEFGYVMQALWFGICSAILGYFLPNIWNSFSKTNPKLEK